MKKLILGLIAMLFSVSALAVPITFGCISNNLAGDCAIGESQLSGTLIDDGTGVTFTFYNTGSDAMFIDGAYFYDTAGAFLSAPATIGASDGVAFSVDATPPGLPSYDPGALTSFFTSDADSPSATNGVNNYTGGVGEVAEWVSFSFDYISPTMFSDLIAAMDSGLFEFGLKVQGYDSLGSETFIGKVPEPGIIGLLAIGLLGMGAARRRSKV